jgi:TatD DNase family protein
VRQIPEDRLLLETDAPFLVPRTLRPRPRHNEPAYLPVVAETVAALRGTTLAALAEGCLANTLALFGPRLKPMPEETRAPLEEKKAP